MNLKKIFGKGDTKEQEAEPMDHRLYMEQISKIRRRHAAKKTAAYDKYCATVKALDEEKEAKIAELEEKRRGPGVVKGE